MSKIVPQNSQIHSCTFHLHLTKAQACIRFPCRLLATWKSNINKPIAKTQNPSITPANGLAIFQETLEISTHMIYDADNRQYMPKITSLSLCLVSFRKPDEQKLVGRVVIDLASVLNHHQYETQASHRMDYCSVKDACLHFYIKSTSIQQSDLKQQDLESEQFCSMILAPSKMGSQKSIILQDQTLTQRKQSQMYTSQHNLLMRQQEEEMKKLHQIIDQQNKDIDELKIKNKSLEELNRQLENRVSEMENEVLQELIQQVREQTSRRIEAQKNMKEKQEKIKKMQCQIVDMTYEMNEKMADKEQIIKQKQTQMSNKSIQYKQELQQIYQNISMNKNSHPNNQSLSQISNQSRINFDNEDNDSQIQNLHNKIKQLTTEINFADTAKEKLQQMSHLLDAAVMEKQTLQKQLEKANIKLQQLQNPKQGGNLLTNQIKSQDDEQINQSELQDKMSIMKNSFQDISFKICILEEQNMTLLQEIRKIQQQNQVFYNHIQKLEQQLQKSRGKNESQSVLKRFQNQKEGFRHQIDNLNRDKVKDNKEIQRLNNQVIELNKFRTELVAKNFRLQNQIKSFELQIEKGKRQSKEKDKTIEYKIETIKQLRKQLENQSQKNEGLLAKLSNLGKKQLQLRENLAVLESECLNLFEIVEKKQQERQEMIVKVQQKDVQMEINQRKMEELKAKWLYLSQQNHQLRRTQFINQSNIILQRNGEGIIGQKITQENVQNYKELYKLQEKRISQLEKHSNQKDQYFNAEIKELSHKYTLLESQKTDLQNNKIPMLMIEKEDLRRQYRQIQQKLHRMQSLIVSKDEKIFVYEESTKSSQFNQHKLVSYLKEENQRLNQKMKFIEKQNRLYEQKMKQQKSVINQSLSKFEERELQKYERQKIRLGAQSNLSKKLQSEDGDSSIIDFNYIQPLSPPSGQERYLPACKNDIFNVCSSLKSVLETRHKKQNTEEVISLLMHKNSMMEQNMDKITAERGAIQEKARSLSMQFTKIKVNALKNKNNSEEKRDLISWIKPCESKVRQLVNLAESLSGIDFIFLGNTDD